MRGAARNEEGTHLTSERMRKEFLSASSTCETEWCRQRTKAPPVRKNATVCPRTETPCTHQPPRQTHDRKRPAGSQRTPPHTSSSRITPPAGEQPADAPIVGTTVCQCDTCQRPMSAIRKGDVPMDTCTSDLVGRWQFEATECMAPTSALTCPLILEAWLLPGTSSNRTTLTHTFAHAAQVRTRPKQARAGHLAQLVQVVVDGQRLRI